MLANKQIYSEAESMISRFHKIAKSGAGNILLANIKKNTNLFYPTIFKCFSAEKNADPIIANQTLHEEALASQTVYSSPEQIQMTLKESKNFEHCYADETDVGNVVQSLKPVDEENTTNIFEILSACTPGQIYEKMDHGSRDLLLYLAEDLNLGMGWGIVLISLGIKFAFLPIMTYAQLNAIKLKLLDPEMKNFQNSMQKFQKAADFEGMKAARSNFAAIRDKYGISTLLPLLSILQIPFLITWFLSLRYVANTPDKFPGMRTDGFLWFQDLSGYDPYFILPLISSFISYYNIQITTYNANMSGASPFARYSRYFKYFPFLSIPVAIFFPSSINLYWICSAAVHLLISTVARSKQFRKLMGVPEYLPGSILEKLHGAKKPDIIKSVFVDSKQAPAIEAESVLKNQDIGSKIELQSKPTTVAPSSEKSVEVLSNKPKKKKQLN